MQVGLIAKGREIGYKDLNQKFVWSACESCGKERWVQLVDGRACHRRCRSCRRRSSINIEEAIRLYCEDKLGLKRVAEQVGTSDCTLWRRLKELGLLRSRKDARKYSAGKGPQNPNWRGGRFYKDGYYVRVWQPEHLRANSRGYVFEHVLVWEEYHKRQLPEGWVIHHINGVKNDNRPKNLLALPKGKHHSTLLLLEVQKKIRELEIEKRQLRRALEDSQMIFYISEN